MCAKAEGKAKSLFLECRIHEIEDCFEAARDTDGSIIIKEETGPRLVPPATEVLVSEVLMS
jgi:hypothetical protein